VAWKIVFVLGGLLKIAQPLIAGYPNALSEQKIVVLADEILQLSKKSRNSQAFPFKSVNIRLIRVHPRPILLFI